MPTTASRRWWRRPTASSSPSATSRSAARASCSAPGSRASPTSTSPGCARIKRCSSGRARPRVSLPDEGLLAHAVERLLDADHARSVVRIIAGDRSAARRIAAPKGTATRPDGRPRPRGGLQPDRPGRRRGRARPLRRLGRDGPRGALARRAALRVRRVRSRRLRGDPRQPREAAPDGALVLQQGRLPGAARGAGGGAHLRSRPRRPAVRRLARSRATPRRGAAGRCSRRTGCSSSRRRRGSSRSFRSTLVTSRRYGSARITLFTR